MTFPTYARSKTVRVAIVPDTCVKGLESFKLRLSNVVGALIAGGIGRATILHDDRQASSGRDVL